MTIGISTAVKTKDENWDRMMTLVGYDFKHIELYNKITRIRLCDVGALADLKKQKGLSYSFHSMAQDLFCDDKIIADAEIGFLKGEIRLASLIGCNHLIFHIAKKTELDDGELAILSSLADMAEKQNVKLCLENNSSSGAFSSDYLMKVAEKIKNIFFCIDIGHLKIALNKGMVADMNKLLTALNDRIAQLHISFNDGKKDLHLAPATGDKEYFESIIGIVGKRKLLIVENKDLAQAMETYKFIKSYV